ncbi:MAG: hypothetical protein ABJN26_20185 [Stappiaceae bacterium]
MSDLLKQVFVPWTLVMAGMMSLLSPGALNSATAQQEHGCVKPETGVWTNAKASAKQITRIEVSTKCPGGTIYYRVRVFVKCAPRDCKWGWTDGLRYSNGRLIADFPGFFAAKRVEMSVAGDRMHINATNSFHDRTQPDQFHSAILKRIE